MTSVDDVIAELNIYMAYVGMESVWPEHAEISVYGQAESRAVIRS